MRLSRKLSWLTACACVSGSATTQEPDLSWIDTEPLDAGEILLDYGGDRRFEGHIRTAVKVDASAEAIWEILRDCESAPEYVPNVLACELLENPEDSSAELFRQQVKLAWFLPSIQHDFHLDYVPYSRIDVSRVSGPFKTLEGTWWLLPTDNGAITLVYTLDFEPGLPIPDFALARIMRRDIPIVLAAVRDRAEALDELDPAIAD